ncbi:MAG: hypothetical protein R2939_01710 [Kofleriaceae bacterium]
MIDLALRGASSLRAGTRVQANLEIRLDRPTTIRAIWAKLLVTEGWSDVPSLESGQVITWRRELIADVRWQLGGHERLAAGVHHRPLTLDVPASWPATHAIGPAWVRAQFEIVVERTWRRHTERWNAAIRPALDPATAGPLPPASTPPGEVQLTVADPRGRPGEVLACALVLGEAPPERRRLIQLALVPRLTLRASTGSRERIGPITRHVARIAPGHHGVVVPVRWRLPAQLCPNVRTASHDVTWELWLTDLGGRADRVGLRLQVVDDEVRRSPAPLLDPTTAAAFEQVARDLITREPAAPVDDGDAPSRWPVVAWRHDQLRLELGHRHDLVRGGVLDATVRLPSLGLGLTVGEPTPEADAAGGLPPWARALRARDDGQAAPVVRAIAAAVASTIDGAAGLEVAALTDTALVLERPAPTVDAEVLATAATALPRLAAALAPIIAAIRRRRA